MTDTRKETDSFGPLEVPVDRYWGSSNTALDHKFSDRLGKAAHSNSSSAWSD